MQVVGDVELGLLQELTDEEDRRGRAVAGHVVLGGGRPGSESDRNIN